MVKGRGDQNEESGGSSDRFVTGLTMLTGCSKAEVEETIQPLVADAIEETDSEAEAVEEQDESPLIPEIDTSVKIEAGSRIAVVSKSTQGEYWKLVKKAWRKR